MCVIYISYQQRDDCPLVIAANRDEFYNRPTQRAHFWKDTDSQILGGRDSLAGGSWFAVDRKGRWGTITNYRDPNRKIIDNPRSRGLLVLDYLLSQENPKNFLQKLHKTSQNYTGFNILCGEKESLCFYSNVEKEVQELKPGLYALSNSLLDTPWPKVVDGKKDFQKLISTSKEPGFTDILLFLQNPTKAANERLPNTGVNPKWEKVVSARFIVSPKYGTRASTLFLRNNNQQYFFMEQIYTNGKPLFNGKNKFSF